MDMIEMKYPNMPLHTAGGGGLSRDQADAREHALQGYHDADGANSNHWQ